MWRYLALTLVLTGATYTFPFLPGDALVVGPRSFEYSTAESKTESLGVVIKGNFSLKISSSGGISNLSMECPFENFVNFSCAFFDAKGLVSIEVTSGNRTAKSKIFVFQNTVPTNVDHRSAQAIKKYEINVFPKSDVPLWFSLDIPPQQVITFKFRSKSFNPTFEFFSSKSLNRELNLSLPNNDSVSITLGTGLHFLKITNADGPNLGFLAFEVETETVLANDQVQRAESLVDGLLSYQDISLARYSRKDTSPDFGKGGILWWKLENGNDKTLAVKTCSQWSIGVFQANSEGVLALISNSNTGDLRQHILPKRNIYVGITSEGSSTLKCGISLNALNAPKNDVKEGAISISSLPYESDPIDFANSSCSDFKSSEDACAWWKLQFEEDAMIRIASRAGTHRSFAFLKENGKEVIDRSKPCEDKVSCLHLSIKARVVYYIQVSAPLTESSLELSVKNLSPPKNDDFKNAEEIKFPFASGKVTLKESSMEPGEPRSEVLTGSIWFKFSAAFDGVFDLVFDSDDCGTINLFRDGDSVATLNDISIITDCPGFDLSCAQMNLKQGDKGYVRVASSSSKCSFSLNIGFGKRPVNSLASSATEITLPFYSERVTNRFVTAKPREGRRLWWKFTPGELGYVKGSLVGDSFTHVDVFSKPSLLISDLEASSLDNFKVMPMQTYWISIGSRLSKEGMWSTFSFKLDFVKARFPNIGSDSAQLVERLPFVVENVSNDFGSSYLKHDIHQVLYWKHKSSQDQTIKITVSALKKSKVIVLDSRLDVLETEINLSDESALTLDCKMEKDKTYFIAVGSYDPFSEAAVYDLRVESLTQPPPPSTKPRDDQQPLGWLGWIIAPLALIGVVLFVLYQRNKARQAHHPLIEVHSRS